MGFSQLWYLVLVPRQRMLCPGTAPRGFRGGWHGPAAAGGTVTRLTPGLGLKAGETLALGSLVCDQHRRAAGHLSVAVPCVWGRGCMHRLEGGGS